MAAVQRYHLTPATRTTVYVNDDLARMWKEAVLPAFAWRDWKNHIKPQSR
jgi:hypothetical protein